MRILTRSRSLAAVIALACVLAISAGTTSCMKATTANIPGSINNADAQIYVELRDLQEAISAAQDQQAAHPQLKPLLDNNVGPAYQKAKDGYTAYHKALVAGAPADSSKSAAILAQINAVKAALAAALKSGGVK